jgi:hypothetical protein
MDVFCTGFEVGAFLIYYVVALAFLGIIFFTRVKQELQVASRRELMVRSITV